MSITHRLVLMLLETFIFMNLRAAVTNQTSSVGSSKIPTYDTTHYGDSSIMIPPTMKGLSGKGKLVILTSKILEFDWAGYGKRSFGGGEVGSNVGGLK